MDISKVPRCNFIARDAQFFQKIDAFEVKSRAHKFEVIFTGTLFKSGKFIKIEF